MNDLSQTQKLLEPNANIKNIQEKLCSAPTYDSSKRKRKKYSKEIDKLLNSILESEIDKCKELGINKQQLTNIQIHQLIVDKGFDISYSTISNEIRNKMNKTKECFIKQEYTFGDRLEYDFGEVKLLIDGVLGTYHIAVLSSPYDSFMIMS